MTTQLLKEAIVIAIVIAEKPSQMIRLEAYTLSNRGRSLRITDNNKNNWLEASTTTINNQELALA